MDKKDCIFCKIARGEIPSEKICENENFFSIPDANPVTNGHTLVISKNHFDNILDIPNSLGGELLDCIKKTSMQIIKEQKADGFNIVNNTFESAGQIVKHFHLHIIPRKKEDGKELKFIDKK